VGETGAWETTKIGVVVVGADAPERTKVVVVVVGATVVVVVGATVVVVVGATVVVVVVTVPHGEWLMTKFPNPVMSLPAGKVMVTEVIVKFPDWLTVLLRKCAVEPPARSVKVATAVLPSENAMLIGPKSAPSTTEPTW
jgi:hypothetical protein